MKIEKNAGRVFYISAFLFLVSLFYCYGIKERSDFIALLLPFLIATFSYAVLVFNSSDKTKYNYLGLTLLAFIVSLFQTPYLSNDFYRFLWDGELFWNGINPFDYRPVELFESSYTKGSLYLNDLYSGIGEMSQQNYSCYPPLTQLYFIISTAFTDTIFYNVLFLKALVLLTEFIGLIYLQKLLQIVGISSSKTWIIFLNPLFLLETQANLHFEGVMISWLIIAFYFLFKKQHYLSGFFFTLAIQVKLIPLVFLPFFWRYNGPKQATISYVFIGILLIGSSSIQLNGTNIFHFMESLRLYFEVFEFNSFILFYYLQIGEAMYSWNMTRIYAPYLSRIAIKLILIFALYREWKDPKTLFNRLSIAFFLYLLLSSTVHPWYILPGLFLTIFTEYIFMIVWSMTMIVSYSFYQEGNLAITNHWVLIEYIPVIIVFTIEMIYGGLLKRKYQITLS